MRTVSFPIAKLGLSIGDTITIKLVDSVGNIYVDASGYTLSEAFTLDSATFEYTLMETDTMLLDAKYKLVLPSGIEFSFKIFKSSETLAHDLISLLHIACYKDVISVIDGETQLDTKFLRELDLYFLGKSYFFTPTQQSLVNLYEYYADNVYGTSSTVDVVAMMDKHLTQITQEDL